MTTVDWSDLPKEHNLSKFAADLSSILESAGYNEMYGVHLEAPKEEYNFPTPKSSLKD